jgi:hypothetical protein
MSTNETKKIGVVFILEAIGRPSEHLTEVLKKITDQIAEEKAVTIIDKRVNEPQLMKDQKDFFTNFAEIEFEVEGITELILLIYKYMPAHIEITHPENISFSNNNINIALNELARRLHGYDEIARIMQVEKNILEKKIKAILEEKSKSEKKEEKK